MRFGVMHTKKLCRTVERCGTKQRKIASSCYCGQVIRFRVNPTITCNGGTGVFLRGRHRDA